MGKLRGVALVWHASGAAWAAALLCLETVVNSIRGHLIVNRHPEKSALSSSGEDRCREGREDRCDGLC